eukprot:Sdes_comp19177_c0_seq2m9980
MPGPRTFNWKQLNKGALPVQSSVKRIVADLVNPDLKLNANIEKITVFYHRRGKFSSSARNFTRQYIPQIKFQNPSIFTKIICALPTDDRPRVEVTFADKPVAILYSAEIRAPQIMEKIRELGLAEVKSSPV